MGHGEIEHQIVQGLGRDARLHMVDEHVERLRGETPDPAHRFEIPGAVQLDMPCLAACGRKVGLDEGHDS